MTPAQIDQVEREVNRAVLENIPVTPYETSYQEAIQGGVTALFGEKYGDTVRVLKIGDYSAELCGGTHVRSTGEIGQFRIISETGVAAGVRRIEAITGEAAYEKARADETAVLRAAQLLKTAPDKVAERLEDALGETRSLRSELAALRKKIASGSAGDSGYEPVPDLNLAVLIRHLAEGLAEDAKALADHAKRCDDPTVAVITTSSGAAVTSASPAATKRGVDAGRLLKELAAELGGRGGGRADFAQGKLDAVAEEALKALALDKIRAMLRS